MRVRQLHTHFVGEVTGLDVRQVRDKDALDEIRALADRYAVLVFRDQKLDDDEHAAFAERFDGQLHTNTGRSALEPAGRVATRGVSDISNLDANDRILDLKDRRRVYGLGNRLWHTDASFNDPPGRYSLLLSKVVPPSGGETEYADMRAAYDALPFSLKNEIEGLRAAHALAHGRALIGFTEFSDEERVKFPVVEWPVVRTIPGSGRKALYIGAHAGHIAGWPVPEGRLLLFELTALATQPQFVYRHNWCSDDLVLYDLRCTMHRATPFDEAQRRDLRRVTTLDLEFAASRSAA